MWARSFQVLAYHLRSGLFVWSKSQNDSSIQFWFAYFIWENLFVNGTRWCAVTVLVEVFQWYFYLFLYSGSSSLPEFHLHRQSRSAGSQLGFSLAVLSACQTDSHLPSSFDDKCPLWSVENIIKVQIWVHGTVNAHFFTVKLHTRSVTYHAATTTPVASPVMKLLNQVSVLQWNLPTPESCELTSF